MLTLHNDFKTIQIALFFIDKDEPKRAILRYLLPRLMAAQTDGLPSRKHMSIHCEKLYGAYFKVRTERIANLSVMSLILTIVDPKIVSDETLFNDAVSLFDQVLYDHHTFDSGVFNDEVRMIKEYYQTLKDKKRAYASYRFNELFFENDPYGYPLSGSLQDLKNLKLSDIKAYYDDIIRTQSRYLVVNGAISDLDLSIIETRLGPVKPLNHVFETSFRSKRELVKVVEETDMKQAIIKIGFILPIYRNHPLFNATILFDTILGGYPESRLFKRIREEEGLCYDIASSYDHYKGILMISSGVDLKKVDHALEEIQQVIKQLKEHNVQPHELMNAKKYYIHSIKSSLDSQSNLTKRAFIRTMLNYEDTIEEKIKAIENVSLEDIQEVTKTLDLDTIYILKGGAQ